MSLRTAEQSAKFGSQTHGFDKQNGKLETPVGGWKHLSTNMAPSDAGRYFAASPLYNSEFESFLRHFVDGAVKLRVPLTQVELSVPGGLASIYNGDGKEQVLGTVSPQFNIDPKDSTNISLTPELASFIINRLQSRGGYDVSKL